MNAFVTLHLPLHAENTCGLEVSSPSSQQVTEPVVEFNLTRCITIQTQVVGAHKQLKPMDKWMHCMQYVPPDQTQSLKIDRKSDWKSVHKGHVLLYIDIPNQQVYPLPLLVTPVHCIYFIAFDVPNDKGDDEKALKRILDTLKDVYAYSSCKEPGLDDNLHVQPNVFLIGLQKEERDRSAFRKQLVISTRSYERLLVFPKVDHPYWILHGPEVNILENTSLLYQISLYCRRTPQTICQLLVRHCDLLQTFPHDPIVRYAEVEAKMAYLVSDVNENLNFEQFLKVLHCFGFIFYRELPDLAKPETFVVLQPQVLSQLFAEIQKLSSQRPLVMISDLFTSTATSVRSDMQEWFKKLCFCMGLVIRQHIGGRSEHIFLKGLNPVCTPPKPAHLSVDPLLVSYRPQDVVPGVNDCFLPSPLFPTFVTFFLEKLKLHIQNCGKPQKFPEVKNMAQHHIIVSMHGSKRIHIVDRESFIEIGLQQFHFSPPNITEEHLVKELQQFCQSICTVVSNSAECAIDTMTLDRSGIRYGFHLCHSKDSKGVGLFGEFDQEGGGLHDCSDCFSENATLQQRIWFQDIGCPQVCYNVYYILNCMTDSTYADGLVSHFLHILHCVCSTP